MIDMLTGKSLFRFLNKCSDYCLVVNYFRSFCVIQRRTRVLSINLVYFRNFILFSGEKERKSLILMKE